MLKRIGYGLILWVIPYALAIPLLPLSRTAPITFHSIMVSIAAIVSAFLVLLYFRNVEKKYWSEAIWLAVIWVVVNWILDFVALLPFTHQNFQQYFSEVGLEYVAMTAPTITLGYLLKLKTGK